MTVRRSRKGGFTLAEMLVVLGIMIGLAGIAIPVFLTGRAATRRTDAENAVRAALATAREAAIQRRTAVSVEFVPSVDPRVADMMVIMDKTRKDVFDPLNANKDRRIGEPIVLPDFIRFDTATLATKLATVTLATVEDGSTSDPDDEYDIMHTEDVTYLPDGTADDPVGTTDIGLVDTTEKNSLNQPVRTVLRVLPSTGLVVEADHREDPLNDLGAYTKGWL